MSQGSASGGANASKSSADSVTTLSSLAKTQEAILKNRESLFQDYFVPMSKEVIASFDPTSAPGKAQMGITANQINQSFDAAQKQTGQKIAQQNLGGSGASLALIAANDRARSSALAQAYANQMAESNKNKATALANFGNLMPQTTTAAPVVGSSSSSSSSWGFDASASFKQMP